MYKNQKKVFKGYLILSLGIMISLCSIIFIPVYSNILKKPLGDIPVIILLILIFIGVFLIIFSSKYNIMLFGDYKIFINPAIITSTNKWFIQGIPNNNCTEFDFRYNDILNSKEIIISEEDNGIFILNLNNKIAKFDMRGWLRKEYYIYEYILSILQLNFKTKVYKTNIINDINNLRIIFVRKNGKNNTWFLVKNNKTFLTCLFKRRLKTKYKIIFQNNKKGINNINNYYHFNKK